MADVATCSAPGCSEPGINKCSSCKITLYCCVACQTKDWVHHKEECQGRLRKLGEAHLQKAMGFEQEQNWTQSLRSSDLALVMLKKLTARSLDVIILIDDAMRIKYNALNHMDRNKEALESAKERYSLWAAGYMRHHGMFDAAFPLIEALMHNKEFEQAHLIASTAYEMVINDTDNIIPEDRRQYFLSHGSRLLALATFQLAESGGIPPEEKQKAGKEAIALACKALEIDTQLYGTESANVAVTMGTLASILAFFNDVDDDEILRLYEQAITIYRRAQGSTSPNVAVCVHNLASVYDARATRAQDANDLDRCVANLELALTHFREAGWIYRINNRVEQANECEQIAAEIEESIIQVRMARI